MADLKEFEALQRYVQSWGPFQSSMREGISMASSDLRQHTQVGFALFSRCVGQTDLAVVVRVLLDVPPLVLGHDDVRGVDGDVPLVADLERARLVAVKLPDFGQVVAGQKLVRRLRNGNRLLRC